MFGPFEKKLIQNNLYHYLTAAESSNDYAITIKSKAVYVAVTAPQPQYPNWELVESHLTFNRFINDNIPVVSSCHFTCSLKSKVDETHLIKLHCYFNAQGKYISSMVSDPRQPNMREPKCFEPKPQEIEQHVQSCQPILTLILQRKLEKFFNLRVQYEALEQELSRQHETLQCLTCADGVELQEQIKKAKDIKKQVIKTLDALMLHSETNSQRSYYCNVKRWINIINRQIMSIEKSTHAHIIETEVENHVLEAALDDPSPPEDVLAISSSSSLATDTLEHLSITELSARINQFLQQLVNKEPVETWGNLESMFDELLSLELTDIHFSHQSIYQRQLKKLNDVVNKECLLGNYQSIIPFFEKKYDSFVDTIQIFVSLIRQILFYEKNSKKKEKQIKLAEFFYNHSDLYKGVLMIINATYSYPVCLDGFNLRISVLLSLVINNNLNAFEMLLKQGVSLNTPHFIKESYPFNALNGLILIDAYMSPFVKKINTSGFMELLFKYGATVGSKPLDVSAVKLISIVTLNDILLTDREAMFNNSSLLDEEELRRNKTIVSRNFKYLHYISNALYTAIFFYGTTKIELIQNLLVRSSIKEQLHGLTVLLCSYEFNFIFTSIGYGGVSLFLNQKKFDDIMEEERKSNKLALVHICINFMIDEDVDITAIEDQRKIFPLVVFFLNEIYHKYEKLNYEERKSIVMEQMLWCNDCSTKQLSKQYLDYHYFSSLIAASYIQLQNKNDYALLAGIYIKFIDTMLPELPRDTAIQDVDVELIEERNKCYKKLCLFASSFIEDIDEEEAQEYVKTRSYYKKMMWCLSQIQENERQECISIQANQQECTQSSSMRP